jgi:hypothetical protein
VSQTEVVVLQESQVVARGAEAAAHSEERPLSSHDRELIYTDVRSQIETGDILLFQGSSPLSRLIRWGSGSVYSHAGIAAWWDDRLLVFQAASRGTEILPVSSAVDAYDGQVDWYALRPEVRLSARQAHSLVTTAVTLLGRSYARSGLVELMWRMARGKFRGRRDPETSPDALFCSQYVSYCYRMSSFDLVRGTDDASTSPGDLAKSAYLELRGVLRANSADKRARAEADLPGRPRVQTKK